MKNRLTYFGRFVHDPDPPPNYREHSITSDSAFAGGARVTVVDVANPSQWPAVIGTLSGAVVGGGFAWLTDLGRWRRQQRVRWDERRVELYSLVLTLTHDASTYANRLKRDPEGAWRLTEQAGRLTEDARRRVEIKGRISSGQANPDDAAELIKAQELIDDSERHILDSRRLTEDSEGFVKKVEEVAALHGRFFLFSKNPVTKCYNECSASLSPLLALIHDEAATGADWDAAISQCETARGAFVFAARKELGIPLK